jgi:hypothetical protein
MTSRSEPRDELDMQREQIAAALPPQFRSVFDQWLDDWTETHVQIARHEDWIASFPPAPKELPPIPF